MKRKSVNMQARVVAVKTRAWEELTPEEQNRVNAKLARLVREACARAVAYLPYALRGMEKEERAYERLFRAWERKRRRRRSDPGKGRGKPETRAAQLVSGFDEAKFSMHEAAWRAAEEERRIYIEEWDAHPITKPHKKVKSSK